MKKSCKGFFSSIYYLNQTVFSFKSMLCDMSTISLETSYSNLRNVYKCNVIIIMRSDDKTYKTFDFRVNQITEFPFAVTDTNVMAKTVS